MRKHPTSRKKVMLRCNWINCILFTLFLVAAFSSLSLQNFFQSSQAVRNREKSLCEWRKIPFTTKNAITVNLFSWQFGYLLGFIKALKKEIYEEFKATFLLNGNNWVKFIAVHFLSYIIHFSDAAAFAYEKRGNVEIVKMWERV